MGIQDFQDELLFKNNEAKLTDAQLLQAMRDEFPSAKGKIFTADKATRLKLLTGMRRLFNRRVHDNQDIAPPKGGVWVANYYSARNPLRLSSLVILGVVARMFRCATRSSCWCT